MFPETNMRHGYSPLFLQTSRIEGSQQGSNKAAGQKDRSRAATRQQARRIAAGQQQDSSLLMKQLPGLVNREIVGSQSVRILAAVFLTGGYIPKPAKESGIVIGRLGACF